MLKYCILFYCRPGVPIHPLSMENWLPFPLEKHRISMYIFYIFVLLGNYTFLTNLNGLMASMFKYATCRLRILQNKLRDSNIYVNNINKVDYSMKKNFEDNFIFCCVEEHLEILR